MTVIQSFLDILYGPRQYVWRSKDYDIPVKFIKVVGSYNSIEYAQVEYEGNSSFVPLNELIIVRSR
jgi:hypothetical protein